MKAEKEFLLGEFELLSFGGAFQRSKIYKKETSEKEKADFREKLRWKLRELSNEYNTTLDDEEHIKNIQKLIEFSEREYGNILEGGKLRVGTAQKLLNLYLKYLWCAGYINMPPHCPFDRIILNKLNIKDNWTNTSDIKDYIKWVQEIRDKSKKEGLSISEWELKNFNRKNDI